MTYIYVSLIKLSILVICLGWHFSPHFPLSLTLLITENSAELIAHIRVDFIPLLPIILSLSSFCYICVPSNWVRYGICVQRRSNNSSSKSKTHTGNIPGCLILVIDYSIRRLSLTQLQLLGSLSPFTRQSMEQILRYIHIQHERLLFG